uniref:OCEL domain-containing protein n=1 Tax=Hippocampus comes TaxID=109280 RepID=A0A3Q2ZDF2_HIPCM
MLLSSSKDDDLYFLKKKSTLGSLHFSQKKYEFRSPDCQNKAAAPGCIPKVHIIADYVMKYPEISCVEEREKYKAVFNDQYQEYEELYKEISATLSKFSELDAVMARLITDGKIEVLNQLLYSNKIKTTDCSKDPTFLEKKQRCGYLKTKLSHIKNRIRAFDQETSGLNK